MPGSSASVWLASLLPPLLGLAGTCAAGLGAGARAALLAALAARLWLLWRRQRRVWRAPPGGMLAGSPGGPLCWRTASGSWLAWPAAASRVDAGGIAIRLAVRTWLRLPVAADASGRCALARQLLRPPVAALWRPVLPPYARPCSRIGYNRRLRASRPGPCPPS